MLLGQLGPRPWEKTNVDGYFCYVGDVEPEKLWHVIRFMESAGRYLEYNCLRGGAWHTMIMEELEAAELDGGGFVEL